MFIVIAAGAGGQGFLLPAGLGAPAALLLVVAVDLLKDRPVTMIPKDTIKSRAGVLLVDDGRFAVSVLVCLAICQLILLRLSLPSVWPHTLFFVGLVLILAGSAIRRAGPRL